MDLRELNERNKRRHPWETSRVTALKSILKETLKEGLKVLDVGCGDGFVARELFRGTGVRDITGVDINLTEAQVNEFSGLGDGIRYLNALPPEKERYSLILLLDVIEHTPDDLAFLSDLVGKRLSPGGRVMITAPAFNSLMSSHDRFLGHRRRYSLGGIKALAAGAGLEVVSSGYLFTTLLPLRLLSSAAEKILKKRTHAEGVGGWSRSGVLTRLVETVLRADNGISLWLNRLGVVIPGLTGWALCEKPP